LNVTCEETIRWAATRKKGPCCPNQSFRTRFVLPSEPTSNKVCSNCPHTAHILRLCWRHFMAGDPSDCVRNRLQILNHHQITKKIGRPVDVTESNYESSSKAQFPARNRLPI
jgi:hypothetical protein